MKMSKPTIDQEREELKANLLKLINSEIINTPLQITAILDDQTIPQSRRTLIAQILDEITPEHKQLKRLTTH